MSSLLNTYIEMFDEYPPKLMMTNYEDEIYQRLLEDAIEEGYPITKDDVEAAYENISIDRIP